VGANPTRVGGVLSQKGWDVIPLRTGADLTASEARKVPARRTPTWNQAPAWNSNAGGDQTLRGNRMAAEAPKADGPTGFWDGEALTSG
jgi:hypothetical protein